MIRTLATVASVVLLVAAYVVVAAAIGHTGALAPAADLADVLARLTGQGAA